MRDPAAPVVDQRRNRAQDDRADRHRRDEVAVHDVDVNQVRASRLRVGNSFPQRREIGRKD